MIQERKEFCKNKDEVREFIDSYLSFEEYFVLGEDEETIYYKLTENEIYNMRAKELQNLLIFEKHYSEKVKSLRGENILEIALQKSIISYLHHALELTYILSCENGYMWYLNNYTSLKASDDYDKKGVKIDFQPIRYKEIIEYEKILYKFEGELPGNMSGIDSLYEFDVLEFIQKKIGEQRVVILYLDDWFLKEKKMYHKGHYVHPLLVYGYSNEREEVYTICFDDSQSFRKMVLTYKEFIFGFYGVEVCSNTSCCVVPKGLIRTLHYKENLLEATYDSEKLMGQLKSYMETNNKVTVENNAPVYYNLAIYEMLLKKLHKFPLDYRAFHVLYEHKKHLYECMQYGLNRESKEKYLEKYGEVVKAFENIRLYCLKYIRKTDSDDLFMPLENEKLQSEIKAILSDAYEKERELFKELIRE